MSEAMLDLWEKLSLTYLEAKVPKRLRPGKGPAALARVVAPDIGRLTLAFNHEAGSLPADYLKDPRLASAYVAQFGLLNAARVHRVLAELPFGYLSSRPAIRILDLGCGSGAAGAGALAHLQGAAETQLVLLDHSRHGLDMAASLLSGLAPQARFVKLRHDLSHAWPRDAALREPFDLIMATHLAVEICDSPETLARWTEGVARMLAPNGVLLLLEPATQRASRRLMDCKPLLPGLHTFAPCPHDMPCPLHAAHQRDWCHAAMPYTRSPWMELLDKLTGLDHTKLAYSYWLCGLGGVPTANHARVVSGQLKRGDGTFTLLCRADAEIEAKPAASIRLPRGARIACSEAKRVRRL